MTTRSGRLLLVATLTVLSASAGALASAPRTAGPDRSLVPPAAIAADTCTATPTPAPRRRVEPEGCTETPPPPNMRSKLFHQLRYHSQFPASRAELVASFRSTSELTAEELAWLADRLPPGVLTSAAGTLSRLFPDAPAHLLARLAPLATLATR
jgi:hypothetical protein